MKFAVCVTISVKSSEWAEFLELMKTNAITSQKEEDGCLQFDVCIDEHVPHTVFLYEIYSSPEAFQQHLGTAHFKSFDSAVSDMIEEKHVKTYSTVI